jgi:Secretion system C-terminal sorting domain
MKKTITLLLITFLIFSFRGFGQSVLLPVKIDSVSVYPVPVKDILNVSWSSGNVSNLEVYNLVGQKIKAAHVNSGSKQISLSVDDLKKGVYFLRLYDDANTTAVKRFDKD